MVYELPRIFGPDEIDPSKGSTMNAVGTYLIHYLTDDNEINEFIGEAGRFGHAQRISPSGELIDLTYDGQSTWEIRNK